MPDGWDGQPDSPTRLQISVTAVPSARARRLWQMRAALGRAPRALPALFALVAVGLAAILAGALQTSARSAHRPSARVARGAVTAAVAAAFGYPHRCLSIAVSPADPDYASAHVDRKGGCARYHGYINATFHRVDGEWRLVLDEGQLFVPNSLLAPGKTASGGAEASPELRSGRSREPVRRPPVG
jgi:hypothetical protein